MTMEAVLSGLAMALVALSSTVLAHPWKGYDTTVPAYPNIDFTTCASEYMMSAEFECVSLTVPIDHDKPRDGSIDLFVSRRKASGTSGSLGSLIFNNGGPGAGSSVVFQAISYGLLAFPAFSQEIFDSYDVIAIDTRGIGYSNPISCDKDIWNTAPEYLRRIMPVSQNSLTKDYELLRQALGEDVFNFVGFSYGTILGQTYAEIYPQKVGRMVLDAVVDRSVPGGISVIMAESLTYQATLEQFFLWCNKTEECSLKGKDLTAIFENLASATSFTCTLRGQRGLGQLLFVESFLQNWTELADGINLAVNGNAKGFSTKLKTSNTEPNGGSDYAARAIYCQDYGSSFVSAVDVKSVLDVASALLPLTRGASEAFTVAAYCAGWPAPVRNPAHTLNLEQAKKLPPLLLVNAFYDPETSSSWAQGAKEQIPSAVNIW
ncbi:Alpha/Beta hydrolase protein [Dactylonectria estremocensis]|uniref:Alpha/Beta hydrolase protein n=1 Tax=Dactylonectria estremocensis TaxID=1079267 RepID=A0A9P9E377_9HYPO|nr:Alpha/Beta hydrolase protein [Dactylonectria estremocensis]